MVPFKNLDNKTDAQKTDVKTLVGVVVQISRPTDHEFSSHKSFVEHYTTRLQKLKPSCTGTQYARVLSVLRVKTQVEQTPKIW